MRIEYLSISSNEPIALEQAKAHLRIDHSEDDSYIRILIRAARERAEGFTGRSFVAKQMNLYLVDYTDTVDLPGEPVSTIDSVEYLNTSNAWITLTASLDYLLLKQSTGSALKLNNISSLLSTEFVEKIRIKYTTGVYASGPLDPVKIPFPDSVRYAMLLMIRTMYDTREDVVTGTIINAIPQNSEYLLAPFRTFKFR